MDTSFRHLLTLLAGIALLAATAAARAVLVDATVWTTLLGVAGLVLAGWGVFALRREIGGLIRKRRGEIALYTLGVIGVLIAIAYFSMRFPLRLDMTTAGLFSLSQQTKDMLQRLDKPVHITFFHDPMMRETVELYQLMAAQTGRITTEFYDPMLNPAQARMRGVEFAGTAIMESEGRRLTVNGPSETDIANGILRVSQGVQQVVCFLEGHVEPDPFSLESHDHLEGTAGHTHGLGSRIDIHERHGIAKARHGLEAMNYVVEKVALTQGDADLSRCSVLVVAGPKVPLLPAEVKAIDGYLAHGGNALFMLDPFIVTGLEPVIREFGVILDDDIVIDEASHFWTDVSAPAVSDYNRDEITRDLPLTFFPGARSLSPTPQRVPGTAVRPLVNSSRDSFGQNNRDRIDLKPGNAKPGPLTMMVIVNRRPEYVASGEAIQHEAQGKPAQQPATPSEKPTTGNRIAVIGDSDFATNSFYHIMGNGKLFLNTVNYLASKENLIGIAPRTYDVPRVNLTNRQIHGTVFLTVILIPALMALVGIAVWWRQR